jgi:hypothetical protein
MLYPVLSRDMWQGKQKRAYHRARSGIRISEFLHLPVKHLILTTSPQASSRNISNDFQALRKAVYREFGVLLPYFMVHTNEGYGVLHVLYRAKEFLPQRWLSAQWERLHLSSYVYVKEVPDTDIARYVVTQYLADQGTSYQRCSWSYSWVCKGFVKAWREIKNMWRDVSKAYRNDYGLWCYPVNMEWALKTWDAWLHDIAFPPKFYLQVELPLS